MIIDSDGIDYLVDLQNQIDALEDTCMELYLMQCYIFKFDEFEYHGDYSITYKGCHGVVTFQDSEFVSVTFPPPLVFTGQESTQPETLKPS